MSKYQMVCSRSGVCITKSLSLQLGGTERRGESGKTRGIEESIRGPRPARASSVLCYWQGRQPGSGTSCDAGVIDAEPTTVASVSANTITCRILLNIDGL